MRSFISRAGRWPLALSFVALGACSDAPSAPLHPPTRGTAADVVTSSELTTIQFTVESATINRAYGDVLVRGTAKCSSPTMFDLVVELRQEQKDQGVAYTVEQRTSIGEFQCTTDAKAWAISVPGYIGLWKSGPATVTVRSENEGDDVLGMEDVQSIRLTRKPSA
jgi:hypothetical protein